MTGNDKDNNNKDLQKSQSSAYKPAYKEKAKTVENSNAPLPSDLTEIITVWSELPEPIKAAIKALIQSHINGSK